MLSEVDRRTAEGPVELVVGEVTACAVVVERLGIVGLPKRIGARVVPKVRAVVRPGPVLWIRVREVPLIVVLNRQHKIAEAPIRIGASGQILLPPERAAVGKNDIVAGRNAIDQFDVIRTDLTERLRHVAA